MNSGQKAGNWAFVLSFLYVGLGSMYLFFILYGDELLMDGWVEQVEIYFFPAFILGFSLAYIGGAFGALIDQFLTLAVVFGILYLLFALLLRLLRYIRR